MATAQEQLMGMLNPQTARLLDNQMRQKQVAQRSQGAGMLSGLTQAYTGMADAVTGAVGLTPMGANEQQAIQANLKTVKDKTLQASITSEVGKAIKSFDLKELALSRDNLLAVNTQAAASAAQKVQDKINKLTKKQEDTDKLVMSKEAVIANLSNNPDLTQEAILNITRAVNFGTISVEEAAKLSVPKGGEWRSAGGNTLFNSITGEVKPTTTGKVSTMTPKEIAELYKHYTTESISAFIKSPTTSPLIPLTDDEDDYDYKASSDKARVITSDARALSELAYKLNSSNLDSGYKGKAIDFYEKVMGEQTIETALRKQFELIKISGMLQYLPPGVASDKDVALVLQGVPDTFANTETMASYVKGLAKLKQEEESYLKDEVSYAKENKGSLKGFTEAQGKKALTSYEKVFTTLGAGDANFQLAYDQAEEAIAAGLNPVEVEQNLYAKFAKYGKDGIRNANVIIQLLKRRGKY